jgi:L-seryl-tRNA(Ser) seleniumtransferase
MYEQLGVRPVINARGNNTVLGGSTPSPRVHQAMLEAERYYVEMQQLLERSGEAIAELLGCEAAYVTPGAAAALALGSAACITGADLAKVARLPDTSGMKHTVLIQAGHRYHYEHAVTVPGAELVEVGNSASDLEAALGGDVSAVMYPAHFDNVPGTLSLRETVDIAHAHGVPVLVDAAGRVYPLDKFRAYAQGADLVAFGAKYVGALNASGILCGRKDLVAAAVTNSFIGFETVSWGKTFGRPLKLDRQTVVAVVAALQEWMETDHDQRLANYERRLKAIADDLRGAPGITLNILHNEGPSPRVLQVAIDPAGRRDATTVIKELMAGSPAIALGYDIPGSVTINPVTLREEDDGVVSARLRALLDE